MKQSETPSEANWEELASKAGSGDSDAFTQLYDHFLPLVFRYVRLRVNTLQEAEDVTSEIWFKLLRALPKYKQQKNISFAAWLFRIAKNALIDAYRKDQQTSELNDEVIDEKQKASGSATQALQQQQLNLALRELPPMQAQTIILKYFAERSNKEVAVILEKYNSSEDFAEQGA